MPRISKLSPQEIEEMKVLLGAGQPLQKIGLRFHIAAASVFYYKKKFVMKVVTIRKIRRKPKTYRDYLRQYCKDHDVRYKNPPHGKYLSWL